MRLPLKYHVRNFRNRLEPEIKLLRQLVDPNRRAIDIGANDGMYSYALAQYCAVVEAFEPQIECTQAIADYSKATGKIINLHHVGLSDQNGFMTLYVPIENRQRITGLGSFNTHPGAVDVLHVPVQKLDDYQFKDVAFLKIDVEGHESQVIDGGKETIKREKPNLLIEIEQRHLAEKSIDQVFGQIYSLGYKGFFLYERQLISLKEFRHELHQGYFPETIRSPEYVRNFIFTPN